MEIPVKKITGILDKLCPVKNIQVRTEYTPWKTEDLQELEARTNLARTVAARNQALND